jgi:hypothetical protein
MKQKISKPKVASRPASLTKINLPPGFHLKHYSWLQDDIDIMEGTL